MRESRIERKLAKKIEGIGGRFYKWVSPGNDGVPDRIAIFPEGRIVFVELKTDRGRLSEVQKYQQAIIRSLGCEVTTVYGEKGAEDFFREVSGEKH